MRKRMSKDIILVGENHILLECLEETYKTIKNTNPKAVLCEGLDEKVKGKPLITTEKLQKITGVEVPSKEPLYFWKLKDFEEYLKKLSDRISELNKSYLNACNYGDRELAKNLNKKANRLYHVYSTISAYYKLLLKNYGIETLVRSATMYSDIANEIPVLPLDDEEAKNEQIKLLRQGKSTKDKEFKGLNKKREETMAESIRKAVEKYGTPVIAVMGAAHLKGVKKRLEGGLLKKIFNRILNRGYKVKTINLDKYELDVENYIKAVLYEEMLKGKSYE